MNKKIIFFCCIVIIIFTGCAERAYYVSPGYGNAMPYHTLPLKKDSIKSSFYANVSAVAGSANDDLRDEQYAFNANIFNANSFKRIKLWYGAGLTLGDYKVKAYDTSSAYEPFATNINNAAGGKFFGSLNENGGVALVMPLGRKSEWRILGVQATLQQEFGNYLHFRKMLIKDSVPVNGNTSKSFLATAGFSTEFSFSLKHGAINLLQQYNVLLGKDNRYIEYDDEPGKFYRYSYLTYAFAVTVNRVTGYVENNFGTRVMNVQFGLNYQLSAKRKK